MALENYTIRQIDYTTAMSIVVKEHYLHRKAPCSIAFGLFINGDIKGVVCYGTPSSATLRSGIAGKENARNVIELTRLWVCDTVPRNGESFLIGRTLKKAGKEIVVSYAEIKQGHIGIVYQATNWLYTGLSAKRSNWTIDGVSKHCQTLADKYTAKEIREEFGDRFSLQDRPRKHRYVYINAKGKRRKEILSKLQYAQQPYPKNSLTTTRIDKMKPKVKPRMVRYPNGTIAFPEPMKERGEHGNDLHFATHYELIGDLEMNTPWSESKFERTKKTQTMQRTYEGARLQGKALEEFLKNVKLEYVDV